MTFELEQDDVLQRFHGALVREIRARNPDQLRAPFTVAEIYQNLVPYRTHRDEIGVEMSADYEHALLRLLAGEGDFLTIESRTARQEIREELESPNPNTGLYRDFAAADVRLNPDRIEEALARGVEAAGEDPVEEVEVEVSQEEVGMVVEVGAMLEAPARASESEWGEGELSREGDPFPAADEDWSPGGELEEDADPAPGPEPEEEDSEPEPEAASPLSEIPVPENCPWCRENLPKRPGVRFCPFCGSNVRLAPCPECGEELELNWRFCIACGTEVAS